MNKSEILTELEQILNRMECVEGECRASLKGYADGAADLAVMAIAHVIDLVSVAAPMTESTKSILDKITQDSQDMGLYNADETVQAPRKQSLPRGMQDLEASDDEAETK